MSAIHLILPDAVDDPTRPSGGNVYDRRIADGLAAHGRQVVEHLVADDGHLATTLGWVPSGAVTVIDGLVGSTSPGVVIPAAARLTLCMLVHLPRGVGSPGLRRAERDTLRACARVLATSDWTRDWLIEHYGLTSVVAAPPGADPAPVATGSAEGGALLCVGRVGRAKGYDVLVDALGRLSDLRWTCAWAGPADDVAPAPVASGHVALLGPLSPTALAARYGEADLVVLPSRVETYGMVLTEALAHGVPVLASDVGGVHEAVGHAPGGRLPGILVPPGDPDLLADALRRWLTEPALRAELRAAARARRQTLHSWDQTAARVAGALPFPTGARP